MSFASRADIYLLKEQESVTPSPGYRNNTNSSKCSNKAEGNRPVLGCVMPLTHIKGYENYPKTRNLLQLWKPNLCTAQLLSLLGISVKRVSKRERKDFWRQHLFHPRYFFERHSVLFSSHLTCFKFIRIREKVSYHSPKVSLNFSVG